MFETFDHTADLGLRARAADLDGLFAEAARVLFSVIVENFDQVQPHEEVSIAIDGQRLDDLMYDWLAELLCVFDTRHILLCQFNVSVGDSGLAATARGEPIDAQRHRLDAEVKAITYHGLKVERSGDDWLAEIIVDL